MSVSVGDMVKKIQQDPDLRQALSGASDPASRIAAFRHAGLEVTAEDLAEAKASMERGELSEHDLERVAGGGSTSTILQTVVVTLSAFG